jgi:tripartite-type tricarboxylate transporter receptor subunit TctC
MMRRSTNTTVAVVAALAAITTCSAAWGQAYPGKPVRVIVALAAGSGADIATRIVAPKLAEALGQQFVVENRGGAGGNIGVELAARAAPDGYTLLMIAAGQTINPALYARLSYDLEKDFVPIGMLGSAPLVLVVHPSLPVKTLAEFIAFAKSHPGQVHYGSSGNGSTPHLAAELFRSQVGIRLVHVPYKGSPQAVTDLVGGQVGMMMAAPSTVMPNARAGRLRALAVASATRSAAAAEVPTMAEAGVPGFEAGTWFGMLAPAGTSPEIVNRVSRELVAALRHQDVRERFAAQGMDPRTATPAEFGTFMRNEIAKWGKAVKASGVRLD